MKVYGISYLLNSIPFSDCRRWWYRRQWVRMCDMHVWCKRHIDSALPASLSLQLLRRFSSLSGWMCGFVYY